MECKELHADSVLTCQNCGLRLQVVGECKYSGDTEETCDCMKDGGECVILCCIQPMLLASR